jgi:hypothetical protein
VPGGTWDWVTPKMARLPQQTRCGLQPTCLMACTICSTSVNPVGNTVCAPACLSCSTGVVSTTEVGE